MANLSEITYRNVDRTPAVEREVEKGMKRLERFAWDLIGCRVCVERPHKHERAGNPVTVRVEVTLPPNHRLVVTKGGGGSDMHYETSTMILDAFRTLERRIGDTVELRRAPLRPSARALGKQMQNQEMADNEERAAEASRNRSS